jgi:hypothetical protein
MFLLQIAHCQVLLIISIAICYSWYAVFYWESVNSIEVQCGLAASIYCLSAAEILGQVGSPVLWDFILLSGWRVTWQRRQWSTAYVLLAVVMYVVVSDVFRNMDPTPLSSRQVCPPPAPKAGGTHSTGGEGDGRSIFWKTPAIVLASYKIISTGPYHDEEL